MSFWNQPILRYCALSGALIVSSLSLTACDSDEEPAVAEEPATDEGAARVEVPSDATALAPGFSPNPQIFRDVAGGDRPGSVWTGVAPHDDCTGYFPESAQHTFQLEHFEQLSILAAGNVDLTMAIEGPHGVWCNDDYVGTDPGIVAEWAAGTYHVFIGTYGDGVRANYTLTMREVKPAETETVRLSSGFSPNPQTFTSVAGGPRSGSDWTGTGDHTHCTGQLPAVHQHEIELTEAIDNLRIVAEHSTDLTMVIEGPAGTWCNDDFQGLNPGLVANWPAGTYKIFVGTYDGSFAPNYTLSLSQLAMGGTTEAALEQGFLPDPYTHVSIAGGSREASHWTATGDQHTDCLGYFPETPQHTLTLGEFPELTITATSDETDLTMVIEGPQGTWCNDDYEGLNPGIKDAFPAGEYQVFIGTYSPDMAQYTFRVTEL